MAGRAYGAGIWQRTRDAWYGYRTPLRILWWTAVGFSAAALLYLAFAPDKAGVYLFAPFAEEPLKIIVAVLCVIALTVVKERDEFARLWIFLGVVGLSYAVIEHYVGYVQESTFGFVLRSISHPGYLLAGYLASSGAARVSDRLGFIAATAVGFHLLNNAFAVFLPSEVRLLAKLSLVLGLLSTMALFIVAGKFRATLGPTDPTRKADDASVDVPDHPAATPESPMDPALEVLDRVFGYSAFRPGQKEIIDCLMAGRDAIAFLPTGAGKSLCYQIPSIGRPGTGLIISPLVALMIDQVAALRTMGVAAQCIHSGLPPADVDAILRAFVQGKLKLLYVAPERAQSRRFQEWLQGAPVSLVAIDEAHCVDRWGHDFREDYLQLKALRPLTPKAVWFACTATADHRTADTIRHELGLEQAALFQGSNDRPNLGYEVVHGRADPDDVVQWIGQVARREAGIIYCRSRTRTETLANQLRSRGLKSVAYHAGLENEVRRAVEARFRSEPGLVVVATVAFGMGIDRSDVRFVIHADPPDSADAYVQEAGRAGRDGLPSHVRLYADGQSIAQTLRHLDTENGPQSAVKRSRFSAFLGYMETVGCRRTALLGAFGETHPGRCGNCDNCLDPPKSWEGREAAALLLAAVRATGSRFGSGHLIDVLLGRETEKVQRNAHHQLPLFGKGSKWEETHLQAVIRHLIARGALQSDEHGGLSRVPSASLPDTLPIVARRNPARSRKRTHEVRAERKETPTVAGPVDDDLFESLRAHRLQVAKAEKVPAFVIFSDATLQEMARTRPTSRQELRGVRGVGDFKLERYGDGFLRVLTQHRAPTE